MIKQVPEKGSVVCEDSISVRQSIGMEKGAVIRVSRIDVNVVSSEKGNEFCVVMHVSKLDVGEIRHELSSIVQADTKME